MNIELEYALYTQVAPEFENFFKHSDNSKILFSGRYGSGKTTFLNIFFNQAEKLGIDNTNYDVFYISPVHYSISANEDIVNLIKYDLITEMIRLNIDVLTTDIPSYQLISEKDISHILTFVLRLLNIKGIDISKSLEALKKLKEHLDEKKTVMDEGDQFAAYLAQIESEANKYENSIVTQLISKVIARRRKEGRLPVLVIDDIDRMDPDHIFRILNVFSAHLDDRYYGMSGFTNKFGFEKVVLVCDYRNIQSLFFARYGAGADFSGYMDKFYSKAIFEFDIIREIRRFLSKVLRRMGGDAVELFDSEFRYFSRNSDELFHATVLNGVLLGELSLRSLRKLEGVDLFLHYQRISYSVIVRGMAPSATLFMILLNLFLFQSFDRLLSFIDRMTAHDITFQLDHYLMQFIGSIEAQINDKRADGKLIVTTALATYTFVQDNNRAWQIKEQEAHAGAVFRSGRDYSMDLLSRLFSRLGEIHKIAD